MASASTRSENENVLDTMCVRLGSLILKEEQKLAVEALLLLKDVMVSWLCYRPAPEIHNFSKLIKAFDRSRILAVLSS